MSEDLYITLRQRVGHYTVTGNVSAHCPDLLRYEQIGEADNMRGRVVRAFFWLMRAWPV